MKGNPGLMLAAAILAVLVLSSASPATARQPSPQPSPTPLPRPRPAIVQSTPTPSPARPSPTPSSTEVQADSLNSLGLAQWHDGSFSAAITTLTQAIQLRPDWAPPYNHRALARVGAGDPASALSDAQRAVDLVLADPTTSADDAAAVLDTRGYVLLRLGRFDEAQADYDQAIGMTPNVSPSFVFGRGLALIGLGDPEAAISDFKWGALIAPAFRANPQLVDLATRAEEALRALMPSYDPDVYEPDNSPDRATALTLDGSLQLHSLHVPGDEDWVSFDLQARQTIHLFTISETCDTYLMLIGPDGTILREDDDGGVNRDSVLDYTARVDGTHHAIVRSFFSQDGTCESYLLGGLAGTPPD